MNVTYVGSEGKEKTGRGWWYEGGTHSGEQGRLVNDD